MNAQYFDKHVLLVDKRKGMESMDVSGDDYRVRIFLSLTTSTMRSLPMSLVSKPKARTTNQSL